MTALATRSREAEAMDAPDLDPHVYAAVLGDLARVNRATLAARPTLAFLDRVARRGDRLRVLDVGFGQGDMLRRIARWGARRRVALDLVGIDLNPMSAPVAAAASPDGGIDYRTGDYAALAHEPWDVVVSSLVAHHMSDAELIAFLRFMDTHAARGWLVNDLHRHAFAYHGFPILARTLRWHPIVRADGRLSIARSFRPADWPPLLAAAGVQAATVARVFPFRLCVERTR